jgi:hypothetical protein
VPNGELSNVRVFSVPRAATAAAKLPAAATELGAVAREPAPSSVPVKVISAACAGAVMSARETVTAPRIVPLVARISVMTYLQRMIMYPKGYKQ